MSEASQEVQSALVRFTSLLGDDVFFVPCKWGTKRPLLTYVERPNASTNRAQNALRWNANAPKTAALSAKSPTPSLFT